MFEQHTIFTPTILTKRIPTKKKGGGEKENLKIKLFLQDQFPCGVGSYDQSRSFFVQFVQV